MRASTIDAVGVQLVAVPQRAARRLAPPAPHSRPWLDVDRGLIRLLVRIDDAQRFRARVHDLDRAHDDAAERVALVG